MDLRASSFNHSANGGIPSLISSFPSSWKDCRNAGFFLKIWGIFKQYLAESVKTSSWPDNFFDIDDPCSIPQRNVLTPAQKS